MTCASRALAVVAVVGLLAGCGSASKPPAGRPGTSADVTLTVRSVTGLGDILVDKGWTLYMYPPDRQRTVTCTKVEECVTAWPPLFLGAGRRVIAGPGVKQSLIGTMPGDGGQIVTYNNWPLYYYIGDRNALALTGQGQGFDWYVMAPDGTPNKSRYASPTA